MAVLTAVGMKVMGRSVTSYLKGFLVVVAIAWLAKLIGRQESFVGIGLESNFRKLPAQMVGGKPIWLYLAGQTFDILLTLLAAYLAFGGILFDPVGCPYSANADSPRFVAGG